LGAVFDDAGRQGASLNGAALLGASFARVFVWRADARSSRSEGALVVAPEVRPRDRRFDCPDYEPQQGAFGFGGSSFAAGRRASSDSMGGAPATSYLGSARIIEKARPNGLLSLSQPSRPRSNGRFRRGVETQL
jgi:hypothetical protein